MIARQVQLIKVRPMDGILTLGDGTHRRLPQGAIIVLVQSLQSAVGIGRDGVQWNALVLPGITADDAVVYLKKEWR